DSFAKENSKVKNCIKSAPLVCPGFQQLMEGLVGFVLSKIGDESTATTGAPGRNGFNPSTIKLNAYLKFCKEPGKRRQLCIAIVNEVRKMLSAARYNRTYVFRILLVVLARQSAQPVRSLSIWRIVRRIVGQSVGHPLASLDEVRRVAPPPTKHRTCLFS